MSEACRRSFGKVKPQVQAGERREDFPQGKDESLRRRLYRRLNRQYEYTQNRGVRLEGESNRRHESLILWVLILLLSFIQLIL